MFILVLRPITLFGKYMKIIVASLLSLILVIAPHYAYANIGGWTVSKIGMVGKTAFTEAISGNKKSIVKLSPTVGMVGKVLRGANGAAALHTAITALLGGVDYVMGEGGVIHYKDSNKELEYRFQGKVFNSAEDACDWATKSEFLDKISDGAYIYGRLSSDYGDMRGKYFKGITYSDDGYSFTCTISVDHKSNVNSEYYTPKAWKESRSGSKWHKGEVVVKTISLDAVAQQVLDQAQSGHQQAQEAIEQAIKDAVKAGEYNSVLESNAKPINGENGKDGVKGKDGIDGKDAPPLDVSGIINAISSLADRMASFFGRLENKADTIIEEQKLITRVINTQTDEIIEQTRGVRIAVESLDMKGELVNQKIDDVINELQTTKDVTKVGLDAIRDALEHGMSGELINQKIDEAIAEAKKGNKTVADAFKEAVEKQTQEQAKQNKDIEIAVGDIEKIIAELAKSQADRATKAGENAKNNTDRIVNAIEQAKSKDKTKEKDQSKENDKPFELPKFCEWAKPVCDFVEWVKKEPEQPNNKPIDIDKVEMPKESVKIDFSATCPPDRGFTFSFVGRQMVFNFSYSNLCKIAISLGSVVKVISTILATYILLGIRS